VRFARPSIADEKVMRGMMVFAFPATALSALYAWLGWCYSRTLARRVVGMVGGPIALAGVGALVWALRSMFA
jgi:hypothetical protein